MYGKVYIWISLQSCDVETHLHIKHNSRSFVGEVRDLMCLDYCGMETLPCRYL